MGEYRISNDTTEHYTSFADLGKAWGCRESKKRSSDKSKLNKDRTEFLGVCQVCMEPMKYNNGVIVCSNQSCIGIKKEYENKDGTKRIEYHPVYRILNSKGKEIAENLFN